MYFTVPNFNPNAIELGFIQIRWYSLAYILAIYLSWKTVDYCNEKYKLNFFKSRTQFSDDFFFYIIMGIIFGGRIFYILFYNLGFFIKNPLEMLAVWHGGMSFHGGFVGVLVASYLLCRKYKIKFLKFTDVIAIATPVGLLLGRLANFINLELYGRKSTFFLAMIFPNSDGFPRHPSQLYEAFFEGLVLFTIIFLSTKKDKLKTTGLNSSLFLIFYSFFRICLEFFREPDEQIGYIFTYFSMGQLLSAPILLSGIYCLLKLLKENKKK